MTIARVGRTSAQKYLSKECKFQCLLKLRDVQKKIRGTKIVAEA